MRLLRLGFLAVCILTAGLRMASGVETIVTLDVTTPDPNDPNYTAPLIVATGGQAIDYSITAIVYTDPNDQSYDANVTNGLGAVYLTLNTTFGDSNCVGEANAVNDMLKTPLGTGGFGGTAELGCIGVVQGDDVADIGGSQDLLGESETPVSFANGQVAIVATGTLVAPAADGVYHVWVTPGSAVSVLEPNLSQPPFGRPADQVFAGQGFYVVVGTYDYYSLTVGINDSNKGYVEIDPCLPSYPDGMVVTLTAVPNPGKSFTEWDHLDPNDPYDSNNTVLDANNPTQVVMDQHRQVVANFKCGSGEEAMVSLSMSVLGVAGLVRRRR